jgi:hypothetical protein
LKGNSTMIAER